MNVGSTSHLVLIPSYNTGPTVVETVRSARRFWNPVWVVVDGSTDGTDQQLLVLAAQDPGVRVLVLPLNQGKGAAVLAGLRAAQEAGFTHALTMDADGQHAPDSIPEFMGLSRDQPDALILGLPIFDESAPTLRVLGRKVSNWLANMETLWIGIGDSLFGLRVYPIAPLRAIMETNRWMRGFDFDPEAVVRLCWTGLKPVNVPTPVRYFTAEQGGVSHYRYFRDNVLLAGMYFRLFKDFVLSLPTLVWQRARASPH